MNKFLQLLESEGCLLLDGAMGTMLIAAGLERGHAPELWNIEHPERVRAVHRAYIEAGSRLILTNSFGGNRYRLRHNKLQDRVAELNCAAGENARAEADSAPHPVAVAGSLGPTGELMAPLGSLAYDDARAAFTEQAAALAKGGVDVLWVETMSDLEEVRAAIEGARFVTDLPIVATLTYEKRGRTMMGVRPQQALDALRPYNLAAVGANCGSGPDEMQVVIENMNAAAPDVPLIAKANAGMPHHDVSGRITYDGTPEVMAAYARDIYQAGARLIGACCGSGPDHIRAMAEALDLSIPKNE